MGLCGTIPGSGPQRLRHMANLRGFLQAKYLFSPVSDLSGLCAYRMGVGRLHRPDPISGSHTYGSNCGLFRTSLLPLRVRSNDRHQLGGTFAGALRELLIDIVRGNRCRPAQ